LPPSAISAERQARQMGWEKRIGMRIDERIHPRRENQAAAAIPGKAAMSRHVTWQRSLVLVGLLGMLIGAIDPLEGSLLLLPAAGVVCLGAILGGSRHRKLLCWAFALVCAGVAALWVLSAFGGIRLHQGDSGKSMGWGIFLLPYPVGWILGVIGAILVLVEFFRSPGLRKEALP
jgi:hypothetical protein